MNNQRLLNLFDQYLSNQLSRKELEEFLRMLDECEDAEFNRMVDQHLDRAELRSQLAPQFNKGGILHHILNEIEDQEITSQRIKRLALYKWLGFAAASLLLIAGGYYHSMKHSAESAVSGNILTNDIELMEDGVPVIQRTDGKEFHLAQQSENSMLEEGITVAIDAKGNKLFKISTPTTALGESRTFISPKGSSLQLELEDGTHVWLNSGAAVTYPALFAANEREIAITGEVFLEVEPDKNRPFIVRTNQTRIKVLGTKFNVSSERQADKVVTTLVEGKVEVQVAGQSKVLNPGFKSTSTDQNQEIAIEKADIKTILAWKEGYFRFQEDRIETVIAKIREWYDIEQVSYLRKADDKFSGMIRRTKSLNELLRQMEKISSFKFKIQDGRVLIM